MKQCRILLMVALGCQLASSADKLEKSGPSPDSAERVESVAPMAPSMPRVLRKLEPSDNRVVLLPGVVKVATPRASAGVPVETSSPTTVTRAVRTFVPEFRPFQIRPPHIPYLPPAVELAGVNLPESLSDVIPPPKPLRTFVPVFRTPEAAGPRIPSVPPDVVLNGRTDTPAIIAGPPESPDPPYPADFGAESAVYCQRQIASWTFAKARSILGSPLRDRPGTGDGDPKGRIYAFADPSKRYKELELDFSGEGGLLRAVFVYPWNLTWIECRKLWGNNVQATDANKGRTFYSYLNRRLDVLVDPTGKVISLGLY